MAQNFAQMYNIRLSNMLIPKKYILEYETEFGLTWKRNSFGQRVASFIARSI